MSMVKVFEDPKSHDIVVWTSALSVEDFLLELAGAMDMASKNGDREMKIGQILQNAMPIAFKLAGYKADSVNESRTLSCGNVSVEHCEVIGRGGKE